MKNKIIVKKIIKYISKILEYTKETEYDAFVNNPILVEACVFNLSQIGELSNKINNMIYLKCLGKLDDVTSKS